MLRSYSYVFLAVAGLGLGSCKSTEKAVFRTIRSNNSVALGRLPQLEAVVESGPLGQTDGAYPDDASKVFRQELSFHLAEAQPDTVKYGYAKLLVTQAKVQRTGRALQAFQMLTLMTPSLLGMPLEWYRTNLKAEVQIIDSKGDVVRTYTGTGRSKVRVAMYHGYSQTKAARLSDVQALRLALDQIRPQLDADADTLRQQLAASGPLEEIIGQSAQSTDSTAVN
ncbi:hypothetical protein HNQ93_001855 [Hymenobacter luteus]|uniref:ABC-type transport auxiliary lipoprotein component domain-containing protein n=2 Tax=Hymenobacter TaxID=89966 RepID=A0A7W9T1E0_9BACT|nr:MULTISPECIES: hypothetical protein [Hymenobacter]MBB4600784.1 hypothetical protein [Hymenobacter latericoloratus]MBB6059009.1 hypothetical protein [Hymenobacter luteus]